jgi:hypothetical protein
MILAITLGSLGPLVSEAIIILAILLVLYVILKLGKLIIGLILNTILGFIAIYLVNSLFSLGIIFNLLTLIAVAIFGLPAAGVIIVLKLLGISI